MKLKNFSKRKFSDLNILKAIPEKRKADIIYLGNKAKIRYLNTSKTGGGSNSKYIKVPKKVRLTGKFIKAFGIYYAEGNKSKTRGYSSFSNTEPEVLKVGIDLFRYLGVSRKKLGAHIKIYNSEKSHKDLVSYWSELTGIKKESFIKTSRSYSKNKYKRNRKRPPSTGLLEIYYSSVVLRDIIDNLLKEIKKISLNDKWITREFLTGIVSGEGSVHLCKNKVRELRIASCDKYEQEFLKKLLENLNIRPSQANCKYYVSITGIENFLKIKETKIFNLHPKKKCLFELGLKNLLSSGK